MEGSNSKNGLRRGDNIVEASIEGIERDELGNEKIFYNAVCSSICHNLNDDLTEDFINDFKLYFWLSDPEIMKQLKVHSKLKMPNLNKLDLGKFPSKNKNIKSFLINFFPIRVDIF